MKKRTVLTIRNAEEAKLLWNKISMRCRNLAIKKNKIKKKNQCNYTL